MNWFLILSDVDLPLLVSRFGSRRRCQRSVHWIYIMFFHQSIIRLISCQWIVYVYVTESTIVAEHSTVLADSTLIGSDCPKHPVQTLSRVYCKDCELQSDREESTHCTSSKYTSTSSAVTGPRPGPSGPGDQDTPTIYCRDRSRKNRTGDRKLMLLLLFCAHIPPQAPCLFHTVVVETLWLASCRLLSLMLIFVSRAWACSPAAQPGVYIYTLTSFRWRIHSFSLSGNDKIMQNEFEVKRNK